MERNALVLVDPQNDFCDQRGALYVDGAAADMARLSRFIRTKGGRFDELYISLDSHDVMAVFHPVFWLTAAGSRPEPFSQITGDGIRAGHFRTAHEEHMAPVLRTFEAMERKGVSSLTIWPEHCIVSSWGHQVADQLRDALRQWRQETGRPVRYIFKGENPFTDQFSIFEGVDDSYPETGFNEPLCNALSGASSVVFAGQALSHCVLESILSYTRRKPCSESGQSGQKVSLLSDCTSVVSGFSRQEALDALTLAGVGLTSTDE